MTVRENLEWRRSSTAHDGADVERRIARVLDLFPDLAAAQDQRAASTVGRPAADAGAGAGRCSTIPRCSLIDELSLGLRRSSCRSCSASSSGSRREGMTMVIVEQSLNVALAVADRAVFLEKGRVRFEGPRGELAERDDLARAVFLGREGG